MRTKLRYDCKDNDNHLLFFFEDGQLDEIHVGDILEKSWTVISAADLCAAVEGAEVYMAETTGEQP